MARRRTPDILGEALCGDFPLALKPAEEKQKTPKKAKPGPLPVENPADMIPLIRELLNELGPMARDFIKGTFADALAGAIDVIADQKTEIARLKTNVSDLEKQVDELACRLNQWIAVGVNGPPPIPAPPSPDPPCTEPPASGCASPDTPSMHGTESNDGNRTAPRSHPETSTPGRSAEDRYREVLVKTIMNLRAKQGLNPVQIAARFENGGLKPLDGRTAWDAEMVKRLVRDHRP